MGWRRFHHVEQKSEIFIVVKYTVKNKNRFFFFFLPGCAMWIDLTFYELTKAQEYEDCEWKRAKDFLAGVIHQIRVCSVGLSSCLYNCSLTHVRVAQHCDIKHTHGSHSTRGSTVIQTSSNLLSPKSDEKPPVQDVWIHTSISLSRLSYATSTVIRIHLKTHIFGLLLKLRWCFCPAKIAVLQQNMMVIGF